MVLLCINYYNTKYSCFYEFQILFFNTFYLPPHALQFSMLVKIAMVVVEAKIAQT